MANKKKTENEEAVKKTTTVKTVKKNNTTKTNNTTKKKETSEKKPSSKTTKKTPSTEEKIVKEEKVEAVAKELEESVKTNSTSKDTENLLFDEIDDGFSSKKSSNNTGLILAIVLILALMVIIICVVGTKGSYNQNTLTGQNTTTSSVEQESANIKDEEKKDLTTINIDEYLSLKDSSDASSVIYIGRPTCSHCVIQKPIMEHLAYKYDITINYLNTDELSDDDITKLRDSDEYFKSGWGTPLTLIVKDGKIQDKIEGEASINTLTSLFKQHSIISE
ncbi:MAG: thioredoxin family protein [Bacilli bacterium]|nr:thioredoxin family protein [Bacilli bacterium]